MSGIRYRVGIDQEKIKNWHANPGSWYSDYENEEEAVQALAKQIKRDLEKWRIYEPKHGSGLAIHDRLVPVEKREQIIRAALLRLTNADATKVSS